MKNPQIFNRLVKNRGTKALAVYATLLLVMQPYALAMERIVSKYPSDSVVATQDIGNSHLLDIGSVFNFNNAKSPSTICLKPGEPLFPEAGCTDNLSLSEVDESNCDPESTEFTFDMGTDGWEGVPGGLNPTFMKFLYDSAAIEAALTGKNKTATFTYSKKFFYECGTPGMSDFKIQYRVRAAQGINTVAGNNYFKVELVKPWDGVSERVIELVPQTNFTSTVAWTWKPGPADTNTFVIPTTSWNDSGVYTIRISGQLKTLNSGNNQLVALQFDDIKLRKTSLWTDYRHDAEYFVKAAPYSQLGGAGNGYILEIKAAKKTGTADNANVLVYNGATWTNKGSISQVYNDTLPQNNLQVLSIPLSDAEYNNGLVRVRYVDATQSGDSTPGGLYIDYQRVTVDQGICVQEVRAIEADCGKCHNYGGDVTKPWPLQGMHNKHAQTESVSDCAWCHPDVTVGGTVFPSDHMNGVQAGRAIELAGTKIYRLGGANPNGDANSGTWDPATGQCTLSECHNDRLTPAWTAEYKFVAGRVPETLPAALDGINVIAQNCSRCHNTGVNNSAPAADDVNNLNITAAWPDTLAHREHDNAFNMDLNSCQANGSCHPDNRVQHTPVDDVAGVTTLMSPRYQSPSGSGVKYLKAAGATPGDGNGRCYNATCHGGQETPLWNAAVGSLDPSQPNSAYCKACHKGEKATTWTTGAILPDISAKQYNSPISGLHQGSPPTSGKSHVSEYGCAVCHTSNPTLHFKDGTGTTNLDSWPMDSVGSAELVTTMGYAAGTGTTPSFTDGTAPTCATPAGLACHAESDSVSLVGKLATTNTPWARDWSWDAYSSTAADRCKVCHGVYGSFKNLRPAHTSPKLAGNHSDNGLDCATTCHAQTDNETIITTNIYNHGVSLTADAKTIDVNMNVGFTQSTTIETTPTTAGLYGQQYVMQTGTTSTVGCTGCHVSTGSFAMQESGWKLRNQLTGPAVTCDNDAAGCHGDSASNRYWPNTVGIDDGTTTADRVGAHELHMGWLANKVYSQDITALLAAADTDTRQRALCQYCHTIADVDHLSATVADVFRTAPKLIQTGVAETGTLGSFETTGNTCSNVDCHAQYGTVAAGSEAVAATPDWYITPTHTFATTTMNCAACHNNPSSDTTGKHTVHAGTSFGVNMTCASCHGASVAWGAPGTPPPTPTTHLNGTFALSSALANPPVYAGTFRTGFGSCGTNYCHRSDASANTAPALTATWGTAQAGSCNFCHLEAMATSKHAQHLASNSLPGTAVNECYVCHDLTATSGGLATGVNHINAADNLDFNTTFANYEANTAARAAGTGATTTCSSVKCHNGITTPAWSSTVACGSCHNTGGVAPTGGPLPSATSVAGEHAKHANNDATYTDCAACHPNAASYTATGGNATHQNLTVNVTVGSAGYTDTTEGGVNYQTADASHTDDGSCAFTGGCHGSGANVGWAIASTLTNGCYDCHGGGLNALETTTTKPAIDAIPNPVNNTEYTSRGHGNTTTFTGSGSAGPGATFLYTGTPGCYNCHDSAATHSPAASATDPFRLGAYAGNTNGMCIKSGCHDSPTILTHSKAVTGSSKTWPMTNYAFKCVDCHDPHGDAANYYMIRTHISAPTTSVDASFGSDSYGTPADAPANVSAVTFTSLTGVGPGSYGIATATYGICEVCHTQTNKYTRAGIADTHNTVGRCDTCHKHDVGFKSGCASVSCHGADNITLSDKNYWPSGAGGAWPDRIGEHDVHVARLATKLYSETLVQIVTDTGTTSDVKQKTICSYCHGALATIGASGHNTDAAPAGQSNVAPFLRLYSGAADAVTVATYTTPNCTAVDCHNEVATNANGAFGWYAGATSQCTMCHTKALPAANTAINGNPSSGLHYSSSIPTVTGKLHDNTLNGVTTNCLPCHTMPAYSAAGTHMNGTFTGLSTSDANLTIMGLPIAAGNRYTATADNVGSCSGAWVNTGCHAGTGDAGTWARKWDSTISYLNTGAECANCHGGFTGAATWNTGVLNHSQNFDGDGTPSEVAANHGSDDNTITTKATKCLVCHVYADTVNSTYKNNVTPNNIGWVANAANLSTYHGNNKIDFDSNRTYTLAGGCANHCHTAPDNTNHKPAATSGWTLNNITGAPPLSCTSCHTGSGGGAKNVGPASTHVKVTVGGTFGVCTNCHNNHTGVAVGGIIIPNNASVGINYATTGHTGIQLGGTGTDASISALTSEAAMCWACHALPANLISEWGANTDPSTGNSTYNYGSVTTYDWNTASWSSSRAQFAYKTAAIQSTHTANPAVTDAALGGAAYTRTETKNASNLIRCTNCHDVHELGLTTGDKKEGAPYLRGSWMGNPYEEDGAPRSVYANTTYFPNIVFPTRTYGWGAVPRGSILQGKLGGYWIDQNNVIPMTATTAANGTARLNPTATWEPLDTNAEAGNNGATSPAFAGLCMLCHNNAGATTALKIDALDKVGSEAIWMGANGHANSVKGGTGATSASSFNVFDARTGVTTAGHLPRQHFAGMTEPGRNGYGFRALEGVGYTPNLSSTYGYGYAQDIWVVDETGATKESQYHKFSCSKCHNPHASRLPKLMITNCLDTVHNTWDNAFQLNVQTGNNQNKEVAQWTSAQNCHRYSQNTNATVASPEYRATRTAGAAGTGAGWNKVTPWMSTSTTP